VDCAQPGASVSLKRMGRRGRRSIPRWRRQVTAVAGLCGTGLDCRLVQLGRRPRQAPPTDASSRKTKVWELRVGLREGFERQWESTELRPAGS